MFISLKLENAFVHQKFSVDFSTGLTTITGKNGKGKTLIVEMLEFALWGTKALRGEADGYKGVRAEVFFRVKDKTYQVIRTITGAKLYRHADQIASGTSPVNKRIEEIFGYSYDVYKVTNVARQGEIERMGQMKPTERKALIDETIGLSKIEALEKWVSDQYKDLTTEIRVLQASMGAAPAAATDAPPEVTPAEVEEARGQADLWRQHAWRLAVPEKILPHPRHQGYGALVAQEKLRTQNLAHIQAIDKLIATLPESVTKPDSHPKDAEYDRLNEETALYREAKSAKRIIENALVNVPEDSKYSDEELIQFDETYNLHKHWAEKQKLLSTLVEYTCPECEHNWHDADPRLADYEGIPDKEPSKPSITLRELEAQSKINAYQGQRKSLLKELEGINSKLHSLADQSEVCRQIEKARKAFDAYTRDLKDEARRQELLRDKKAIVVPDSVAQVIQDIEVQHRLVENYHQELSLHLEAKDILKGLHERIIAHAQALQEQLADWNWHVKLQEIYEAQVVIYNDKLSKLEALQAQQEQWQGVKKAIVELRLRIKGYLLPSLNEVATRLISLMSNGWLNKVELDEDFKIKVDDKYLHLLSGAGKALTNLALRIGLGQVLTNGVFSVLILDEADQGVDQEKAPMVAEALRLLTGQIQQIIVISHKTGLVADHRIEL